MAIRTTASGRLLRTTSLLDHEQAYTYAMWLYWAGSVNQAYVLNINEDGVANYDLLGSNSAGNLWLRSHFNSDGDVVGSTLSANTWYHVAMVRESVTSLKAYLNGVLDGTSTLNVTGRGLPVRLDYSGYASGGTSRLDGRGSQFKAWSAALTADELKAEMRSGLPVRWNNLHMFTPLLRHDDVKDYSGAGRDWTTSGTITTEDGPPVTWWPGVAFVEFEVAAAGDTIVGAVGHKAAAVYGSGSLVSASTITDAVGHRSSATYGVGAIVSASTISDAVGHVAGAVFGSGTLMAAPAGTLADTVGHRAGTAYGAGAIVSAGVIAGVVGHVAGTVYGAGAIVSVGAITDIAGHRGGVAY